MVKRNKGEKWFFHAMYAMYFYHSLNGWCCTTCDKFINRDVVDDFGTCCDCGVTACEECGIYCACCTEFFCEGCVGVSPCGRCDRGVCQGCLDRCGVCDKRFCEDCGAVTPCQDCEDEVSRCPDCMETHECKMRWPRVACV